MRGPRTRPNREAFAGVTLGDGVARTDAISVLARLAYQNHGIECASFGPMGITVTSTALRYRSARLGSVPLVWLAAQGVLLGSHDGAVVRVDPSRGNVVEVSPAQGGA